MSLTYADRVKETTTTTGTGTLSLAGAATQHQTFVAGIGNGGLCVYCLLDANGTDWEVGVGTVTDATPDTLSRTTILASSNAGAAINLSAGTHTVFCTQPGAYSGRERTIGRYTPMTSQPPATNYATLDTRNSIAVLDFDDTTEEGVFWVDVMPHWANLADGLKVTVFFMATSATSGNVRWGVKFERMNTDEDSDSFDTATENHGATNGTSGIINSVSITCTTIDSIAAGDPFRMWVYRDASDTTNDTVTGDAELVAVLLETVR